MNIKQAAARGSGGENAGTNGNAAVLFHQRSFLNGGVKGKTGAPALTRRNVERSK